MTMSPALPGHPANRRALYAATLAHFPLYDYFEQYIRAIHEHRQRYIAPLVADLVWELPRGFSSIFDIHSRPSLLARRPKCMMCLIHRQMQD